MAKLTLKANPTFKASVGIPVAGEEKELPLLLTFKHRTKTQLAEFVKSRAKKSDVESFLDMVCAWEFEEEFIEANITEFLENHGGAAVATYRKYVDELTKAKAGN